MRVRRKLVASGLALMLVAGSPWITRASGRVKHSVPAFRPGAVITFGLQGGNIRPWSVTIDRNGTITAASWVAVSNHHLAQPAATLKGLTTLARAEKFAALPANTQCHGVLPDVASRYITLSTNSGMKTVAVHGNCVGHFKQFWAVLNAVAGTGQ